MSMKSHLELFKQKKSTAYILLTVLFGIGWATLDLPVMVAMNIRPSISMRPIKPYISWLDSLLKPLPFNSAFGTNSTAHVDLREFLLFIGLNTSPYVSETIAIFLVCCFDRSIFIATEYLFLILLPLRGLCHQFCEQKYVETI